MRNGVRISGVLASFAAGLALALSGCGDETEPAATTGERGENTATLSPRDTTTEQSVTDTGLTATTGDSTTAETETTETDGEDDDTETDGEDDDGNSGSGG